LLHFSFQGLLKLGSPCNLFRISWYKNFVPGYWWFYGGKNHLNNMGILPPVFFSAESFT
jgi:hypothetical protein